MQRACTRCSTIVWGYGMSSANASGAEVTSIVAASIVVNPLPALLATLPQLRMVACNGTAAAQAWRRYVQPLLPTELCALPVVVLPSTSPANAAWSLPRLATAWQPLCDAVH